MLLLLLLQAGVLWVWGSRGCCGRVGVGVPCSDDSPLRACLLCHQQPV